MPKFGVFITNIGTLNAKKEAFEMPKKEAFKTPIFWHLKCLNWRLSLMKWTPGRMVSWPPDVNMTLFIFLFCAREKQIEYKVSDMNTLVDSL